MLDESLKEMLPSSCDIKVVEYSTDEEVLSNASSPDMIKVEEHIVIRPKMEPLPWSLRHPTYNKPLPNISHSSFQNRFSGRVHALDSWSSSNETIPLSNTSATPRPESPPSSTPQHGNARKNQAVYKKALSQPDGYYQAGLQQNLRAGRDDCLPGDMAHPSANSSKEPTTAWVKAGKKNSPENTDLGNTFHTSEAHADVEVQAQVQIKAEEPASETKAAHVPAMNSCQQHPKKKTYRPKNNRSSEKDARRYLWDWKVNRKNDPEQFFVPDIFDEDAHSLLKPASFGDNSESTEALLEEILAEDLGVSYRFDWQVQRKHDVCECFNPDLFEPSRLACVNIPPSIHQRRRAFRDRMRLMGIKDRSSPAAKLRLSWAVSRANSIERFFEPGLFEEVVSEEEKQRKRASALVDEEREKVGEKRGFPPTASKRDPRPSQRRHGQKCRKHYNDLGDKYQDDWQTERQNDVTCYFEPSLFDEDSDSYQNTLQLEKIINVDWFKTLFQSLRNEAPSLDSTKKTTDGTINRNEKEGSADVDTPQQEPAQQDVSSKADPNDWKSSVRAKIYELRQTTSADDSSRLYDWDFWDNLFANDDPSLIDLQQGLLFQIQNPSHAGVPKDIRPAVWKIAAEAFVRQNNAASAKPCGSPLPTTNQSAEKHSLTVEKAQMLQNVAMAYASCGPKAGSCAKATEVEAIAAPLIAGGLSEEEALALLRCIMDDYDHRAYFGPNLGKTSLRLDQLEELLADADPELAVHLESHDAPVQVFAEEWYSQIFPSLPSDFREQIIDAFLVEKDTTIHKVALALLVQNREKLLEAADFVSIMQVVHADLLKVRPEWDGRQWMQEAYSREIKDSRLREIEDRFGEERHIVDEYETMREMWSIVGEHQILLLQLCLTFREMHQILLEKEKIQFLRVETQQPDWALDAREQAEQAEK